MRKARYLPDVVKITPSNYGAGRSCIRRYFLTESLNIPQLESSDSTHHGRQVHALLRLIHDSGDCSDTQFVSQVLMDHGADEPIKAMIERHQQMCPSNSERGAHEVSLARFSPRPFPPFVASCRIDALWVHDGLLDARDYKAGASNGTAISELSETQVQAWILARFAKRQGLALRLRNEYLAAGNQDDPEPWEPSKEDIESIGKRLRGFAQKLREEQQAQDHVHRGDQKNVRTWRGVGAIEICGICNYQEMCRDSATKK